MSDTSSFILGIIPLFSFLPQTHAHITLARMSMNMLHAAALEELQKCLTNSDEDAIDAGWCTVLVSLVDCAAQERAKEKLRTKQFELSHPKGEAFSFEQVQVVYSQMDGGEESKESTSFDELLDVAEIPKIAEFNFFRFNISFPQTTEWKYKTREFNLQSIVDILIIDERNNPYEPTPCKDSILGKEHYHSDSDHCINIIPISKDEIYHIEAKKRPNKRDNRVLTEPGWSSKRAKTQVDKYHLYDI